MSSKAYVHSKVGIRGESSRYFALLTQPGGGGSVEASASVM
jgi:hypothetical protein